MIIADFLFFFPHQLITIFFRLSSSKHNQNFHFILLPRTTALTWSPEDAVCVLVSLNGVLPPQLSTPRTASSVSLRRAPVVSSNGSLFLLLLTTRRSPHSSQGHSATHRPPMVSHPKHRKTSGPYWACKPHLIWSRQRGPFLNMTGDRLSWGQEQHCDQLEQSHIERKGKGCWQGKGLSGAQDSTEIIDF